MTVFNLDSILKQIVSAKNKKFVKELQGEGMREEIIEQTLREDYYENIYSYLFPRAKILECKKNCLSLSYSMRKINVLLDDENILEATKELLLQELNSLRDLYDDQKWIATIDSAKKYRGPGNPKSWKQRVGFQIRFLYEYIKPLSEAVNGKRISRELDYKSKDVFELIKELFSIHEGVKFKSWKQLKTIFGNIKRRRGRFPGRPIRETRVTKVSAYEWKKIQKA